MQIFRVVGVSDGGNKYMVYVLLRLEIFYVIHKS